MSRKLLGSGNLEWGESGALLLALVAMVSLSATALFGKSLADNFGSAHIAFDVDKASPPSGGLPPSFGGPNLGGLPGGSPI